MIVSQIYVISGTETETKHRDLTFLIVSKFFIVIALYQRRKILQGRPRRLSERKNFCDRNSDARSVCGSSPSCLP